MGKAGFADPPSNFCKKVGLSRPSYRFFEFCFEGAFMMNALHALAEVARDIGWATLRLGTQPFYYIAIVLVMLVWRRQVYVERRLFSVKLHRPAVGVLVTIGAGIAAGLAASLVMSALGSHVNAETLYWLWGLALLFACLRIRWMCFAYAAGALGVLQTAASAAVGPTPDRLPDVLAHIVHSLQSVHMPSVLALVAVMHLAEAALVRFHGTGLAMPIFVEGKRGKVVGGYQLQGYWPVPLILLVPASAGALPDGGFAPAWTPLFGGGADAWAWLAFPAMIGFAEQTTASLPKPKARRTSNRLAAYGVVLLAAAAAAEYVPWLVLPAAGLSVLLHEGLVLWSRLEESASPPRFVHGPKGLTVLGVIPRSPAEALGIAAGQTIARVNGVRVAAKEDLHMALRQNPAYVKLEMIDENGEIRFMQRALYAGEHHQLGIILAPDEDVAYIVERAERPLAGYVWMKLAGLLRRLPPRAEGGGAERAENAQGS